MIIVEKYHQFPFYPPNPRMADHWEDDEDVPTALVKDDDDDAPDDWEAELEKKPESAEVKPVKEPTKKKRVVQIKLTESDKGSQRGDDDDTPNELNAMQKQQEADKALADANAERFSLDNTTLINRDEFLNYSQSLANRLGGVSKSEFYPDFLDHFLNGLSKSLTSDDIKRLTATMQVILLRKQSDEREKKLKAKAKKSVKPQLKTARRTEFAAFGDGADQDVDDDYDDEDFM